MYLGDFSKALTAVAFLIAIAGLGLGFLLAYLIF